MIPSAVACRLTILGMFLRQGRRDENGPYWFTPQSCYLHTLTFADPEPSYEVARKRWHSFRVNFLEKRNRFGVCVPQWGEQTFRLHFHLVTSERWDAAEMWAVLPRYGFGRYDVNERPVSAAGYAARYVGRRNGRPFDAAGTRLWSVFGKKHFPHGVSSSSSCAEVVRSCIRVAEVPHCFADWLNIRVNLPAETFTITCKLRADAKPDGPTRNMNEITQAQIKLLVSEASKGGFVGIGEYRSCTAVTREMQDFKDKSKSVKRVFVEHRVEFGGVQVIIEERLPDGSDERTFIPPAKSGESIGFVAQDKRTFNSKTTWKGRLFSLASTSASLPVAAVK